MLSSAELNADDEMVGMHCLLLPLEDVTVLPTWDTVGMRGTGSCDVQVENVFVPSHRAIPFHDLLNGTSIGARESSNPTYRIPLIPYLSYTALAPVIGMGKGAVAVFQDYLEQRLLMSGKNQKSSTAAQIRLATASNNIAAAEALMDRGVADLIRTVKEEMEITIQDRVRFRSEACFAASLVKQAINELAAGAGAKAQFKSHPLQKFQRDINTISGHVVFDMDTTMELQGRVQLGMEPENPLV
jgi:alkylation response protein AidB-like acyl-CoA dehydrogenase